MADVLVPPFDIMFLAGIWIETVLYGLNTIVFGTAIFVLTRMYRAGKPSAAFLLVTSVFLFSLSTVYISVCLRQLFEAFIWGPPGGASLYFANIQDRLAISKLVLYEANAFTQDMILIWRMWVIYNNSWIMVIIPTVMEFGHISAGIYSIRRGVTPNTSIFDPFVHRGAIANWSLDLAVNIGVTTCIVYKLWTAGRSLEEIGLSRKKHPYTSVIFTVIESGGIFATATLITVSLYLSGNLASVAAIDSVVQLATITPLLIVVRVGLGLQHGIPVNTMTFELASMNLDSSISRVPGLQVHIPENQNTFGKGTAAAHCDGLETSDSGVKNYKICPDIV
ncbi:hypothetical protein EV361DRAFT_13591 [Lentinula raphanica]|uniref:Uncharacterized protein n=1 Tax=Lentinula raphanica TaxID=153919 RepID=A0AA38U507_9AGAR|nr:hypothetical protein F5880DRAFT_1618059 [Lentinula raphanica]KAJ3832497.1 hypothetical protein F5878DRAFT_666520 [Lentinula raphanica]KAJ3964937.1 hypothetical protein EV361DRAFT_13591 [Lentinula raphanica]